MYLRIKITLSLIILIFLPFKLNALENKILFKVNDKIITTYDILKEIKYLNLLNEEFKNFEDSKIYEVAKNSIIKEKIKEDELEKIYKELKIDEKFIENFLINYFKKYNLNTIENVGQLLKKNDLKLDDIKQKMTIQLMWNEYIFQKFSKNVKINRNSIENEISKKETQAEYFISEIVFNVNNKKELNEKFAKIKEEIDTNNFYQAAIMFSESETSINGGKIGWIKESSLTKKIRNELKKIKIGESTNPIKIPGAFIILNIEDKKQTKLDIDINQEIQIVIKKKTNDQLNQFSNIYFNKIKKNVSIDEL
tara:strand:+ start:6021 stop:6947 length:927 start_codon:yes stop_codon:yes gene_type:complete